MKTNNSLKQQRQLIASLLPPVPNFPTNSSSNPAPFPEQGLFRNSLRSGPCTSSGAGCRAAGSASATAASLLLRPVCHTGFPAGRDARAALLFHHPSSFPNPPLRPFSPKHTGTQAARSRIVLRARLREQDLHKPSKLRTRRPDSSARGPQCPHRRSRRFCVAPSRLDTAANSPLGCSLGRAGGSWRFGRGRRGAGWRICCRRINTSGRGEGQRRCRTRRGPGIPARSSLGRRFPGPRSPDAPARPAPRPRPLGPAARGAEEPRAAQGGGQRPAHASATPGAGARRAPGERASGGGRAGGRGARRRGERRGRNFEARCPRARRRCEAAAAAPAGPGRVSAGGAARGAACAPSKWRYVWRARLELPPLPPPR